MTQARRSLAASQISADRGKKSRWCGKSNRRAANLQTLDAIVLGADAAILTIAYWPNKKSLHRAVKLGGDHSVVRLVSGFGVGIGAALQLNFGPRISAFEKVLGSDRGLVPLLSVAPIRMNFGGRVHHRRTTH